MKGRHEGRQPRRPMLTGTGREIAIQTVLDHELKTGPGVPPQRQALDDASADAPRQARNGAKRDACGLDVRVDPGFHRRHRGRSCNAASGRGRVSLVPRRGQPALGQAVPAAHSIFVSTAKGRAFLPGLNAGASSVKFR